MESQSASIISRRFIAVCDVLGFKDMLRSKQLDEFVSRYNLVVSNLDHTVRSNNRFLPEMTDEGDLVHAAIFSDTILIWSASMVAGDSHLADLGSISVFFDTCSSIVNSGIIFGFPFRIGIAYGEVAIDPERSFFVGQPIVDAHLLEASQEWIGGACHDSCFEHPAFQGAIDRWWDLIIYDVPLKTGFTSIPALNWPKCGTSETKTWLHKLTPNSSDSLLNRKYANTEEFFTFARLAHRRFDIRRIMGLSADPGPEDSQETVDKYSELLQYINAKFPL